MKSMAMAGSHRTGVRNNPARHNWLHFTRMGEDAANAPMIVAGKGCYVRDAEGRDYFDALAGLFAVQIGYSHGAEIAEAAAAQLAELPYWPNWGFTNSTSARLSEKLIGLAPDGIEYAFFVSGGSEANESAWKLARQYHRLRGQNRWKVISRKHAYHGTSMGALALTALPKIKEPFEPLPPGAIHVRNASRFRRPAGETETQFVSLLLDDLDDAIQRNGPDTIAMVIMEPVQTSGGAIVPPAGYMKGVREICDRYGILLCADEVISGFGRLGHWFASSGRYPFSPDLITCAKGLSSAYGVIGALLLSAGAAAPFIEANAAFAHGVTFGGHPLQAAIALRNLEIMERELLLDRVLANEASFAATLNCLRDLPMVGDVRGAGYLYAIELVRDSKGMAPLSPADCDRLSPLVTANLQREGLICRVDMRSVPALLLSPPLIAGPADFTIIEQRLRAGLTRALSTWPR